MSLRDNMDKLPFIVAIDFDGTLVYDQFPNIGGKRPFFDHVLKRKRENPEMKLVLWTCRTGEYLQNAVAFCIENGLELDAVNKNIPEVIEMFGEDTRKVFADEYWDDKTPFENGLWCHES